MILLHDLSGRNSDAKNAFRRGPEYSVQICCGAKDLRAYDQGIRHSVFGTANTHLYSQGVSAAARFASAIFLLEYAS